MTKKSALKTEITTEDGTTYLITPHKILFNGEEYRFITNTEKKRRIDLQKAAELNGYSLVFVDNASSLEARALPDMCSVYMKQSDFEQFCSVDRLFNTCSEIASRYRKTLSDRGYDVDDIPLSKIYLGCERYENIPLKKS